MKSACYLSILLIVFLAGPALGSEGRDDGIIHVGVSKTGFMDINQNDAAAALKAWAATVIKEQRLKVPVEVAYMPHSINELRSALEEHRLDALSITVADYMALDLKADEVYIPATDHGIKVNYVVIVREDSGISRPKDLLGRNLVMGTDNRIHLAQPWLQTLVSDRDQAPNRPAFRELTTVENPSKAILQIFFHQADAALVIAETFDLACELNPQLRNNIKVIATSQPFVSSVFVFTDEFNHTKLAKELEKALLELHTTPGGRQLLTVFKSTRMEKFPISVLDATIQFLANYRSMIFERGNR